MPPNGQNSRVLKPTYAGLDASGAPPDVLVFRHPWGGSMPGDGDDITLLLQKWRDGSATAEEELFAAVMPNLRRLAHHMMQRERRGHTLQATELVDQIYFRMVAAKDRDWQNRQHF